MAGGGNENDDLVRYEIESLTLQLRGALDAAATVVAHQLAVTGPPSRISWSEAEPRRTMRREWEESREFTLTWKRLAQILALIRNQIHGEPLQSISSMDDEVFIVLPRPARLAFVGYAAELGGGELWGVRDHGMFDPWALTEMAVASTRRALREIAGVATRSVVQDKDPEGWPWDGRTLRSSVRLLGLEP